MIPKIIKLDLRTEDRVSYPAGFIGENNYRTLHVLPPPDLAGAAYYRLAFELADDLFRPDLQFNAPIKMLIPKQITNFARVPMTLEGYSADGSMIGKSRKVALVFKDSAAGRSVDLTGPPGLPGENGATFFPAVAGGTLSWTNDKNLENPEAVDITGPPGPPGPDAAPEAITNMELDDMINFTLSAVHLI